MIKDYGQVVNTLWGVPGVLILGNILISIGAGLVVPLFPRYLEVLGATPTVVGGIMATDYLLLSLGLVGGYLGDKLGRKKFIRVTHCFFPFILLWFIFARHWVWVLIGMLMLGIRVTARPVLEAVMADETPPEERGRVYSINWLAITLASILSSLLLSFIVHRLGVYQGTRLGFLAYFALSVLVATLFWLKLKEPEKETARTGIAGLGWKQFFGQLRVVTRNSSLPLRFFVAYYFIQTPARGMLTTYYVLYLVHAAGVSDGLAALVYSIGNGVYLVAQLILGPLTDRINKGVVLLIVTAIILSSSLSLLAISHVAVVAILSCIFMLSGLSLALYLHGIILAEVTDAENRATLFGLISAVVAAEGVLCLILGGWLFQLNPRYPFILSVGFFLVAVFILMRGLDFFKKLKEGGSNL